MPRFPAVHVPLLAALLLSTTSACDSKSSASSTPALTSATPPPPPPPPPAAGSAAATTIKTLRFSIDPASKTSIDMPAPKERIRADTTAAAGELTVTPSDLSKTRGQVKVDLTTLSTHTFDDATKDHAQTEHAHNWLEAGDLVTPEVKAVNRWVIFTIREIGDVSAPSLAKVPVTSGTGDDTRVVSAVAKGDFFLHGHTVAKDVPVEVVLHYAKGQADTTDPTRLEVRTKAPLHVVLAEHDVKPRDGLGKLAQGAFNLLGTKVAETADVTLSLNATPSAT